ncbi:maleylpyruvate isomerase family mycothiol-dependent enzyme [Kocuria nitroreducens]|uniref:maleylpyruvate isomerase family mycothiol-dependent enzyme n=1 Tax=Kocuria nitroreducens TaxID=3058914 RepID=UPI0036DA07A2
MAQDHARMRALAGPGRTAAVPACPDWNGDELMRHTALVYLQKAETVRTGTKPRGQWLPEELRRMNSAELLGVGYDRLIEQFDAHDPADPAESWVPGDQTVGFWIRRLAHETAIHRYDLEAALGAGAPIDAELAVDGIDEVLTVMLGRGAADETASGAAVAVETDGKAWCATLEQRAVRITRERCASPAGKVTGSASDVLLWLWGRGPLPEGSADSSALAELRRRLAAAT